MIDKEFKIVEIFNIISAKKGLSNENWSITTIKEYIDNKPVVILSLILNDTVQIAVTANAVRKAQINLIMSAYSTNLLKENEMNELYNIITSFD